MRGSWAVAAYQEGGNHRMESPRQESEEIMSRPLLDINSCLGDAVFAAMLWMLNWVLVPVGQTWNWLTGRGK